MAVDANAIHAFGNDPRGRGFAGSTNARHNKGLRDAVGFERVFECPHHGVLTDKVCKGLGPVFARKDLIGGCVGHGRFPHWCNRKPSWPIAPRPAIG